MHLFEVQGGSRMRDVNAAQGGRVALFAIACGASFFGAERSRSKPLRPSVSVGLIVLALCLAACTGPGHVQYDGGRCLLDGRVLSSEEVESEQALVARRIASRQPWFAVITISVVLLAAAGNAEKALIFVRARHGDGHRPLSERLREALARQRETPARFIAIVGSSLALIALAGGTYIYLDIDKRASERALGMLQFCHLALRTREEAGLLSEQRHNLEAIEATAGDIRALVGKLPPDEQRKAKMFVDAMNSALAKQGQLVGAYVARTDEAQKALTARTAAMEKGIASVEGDLAELRTIPRNLKDLETATRRIDETTAAFDRRFGDLRTRLTSVDEKLGALLARPECDVPSRAASTSHAADAGVNGPESAAAPSPGRAESPSKPADAGGLAPAARAVDGPKGGDGGR